MNKTLQKNGVICIPGTYLSGTSADRRFIEPDGTITRVNQLIICVFPTIPTRIILYIMTPVHPSGEPTIVVAYFKSANLYKFDRTIYNRVFDRLCSPLYALQYDKNW